MDEITGRPIFQLVREYAGVAEVLEAMGALPVSEGQLLGEWLEELSDEALWDAGVSRDQVLGQIAYWIKETRSDASFAQGRAEHLTIMGGMDKDGRAEISTITMQAGEVWCVVGPTGSGKSRLLADVECLAQGDTPTGRRILIDGHEPPEACRSNPGRKLVAQLSQNMNFVVDMSAGEMIAMHARCRGIADVDRRVEEVIACANRLAGECFSEATAVTQLSGGQARALMIADVALLSAAPIVLIDEIENAGIDRRRALELLTGQDKIVLISTHDPLLALRGHARLVIRNGGMAGVLETNETERRICATIESMDNAIASVRERLRCGERIEESVAWPCP